MSHRLGVLWTRKDRRATGRIADVVMVAFHPGALADDVPMSLSRFGGPSAEAIGKADVVSIEDPSWIGGWRAGSIRNVAAQELGPALATLDAATRATLIRATIADPPDLGYLQACWSIARWLVARGATIVLDAFPIRFHPAAAVAAQDPSAPLDITREVAVIFEAEPEAGRLGHVVHTRGLGKLARPDLVALVPPAEAAKTSAILWSLASALADGFMPRPGGSAPPELALTSSLSFQPMPLEEDLAQALHLNNDALLVEL